MTAQTEGFNVVALFVPEGVDEAVASRVNARIDELNPDYWLLTQPDTYVFFFRQRRKGAKRAANGVELLESLRSSNERLSDMRIGQANGPLLADFSWFGTVLTPPLGAAAHEANKKARNVA